MYPFKLSLIADFVKSYFKLINLFLGKDTRL